jgi:hypothetical protein
VVRAASREHLGEGEFRCEIANQSQDDTLYVFLCLDRGCLRLTDSTWRLDVIDSKVWLGDSLSNQGVGVCDKPQLIVQSISKVTVVERSEATYKARI